MGYGAAMTNPKIGTFPLAFTSAGGATSTKQSEKRSHACLVHRMNSVAIESCTHEARGTGIPPEPSESEDYASTEVIEVSKVAGAERTVRELSE